MRKNQALKLVPGWNVPNPRQAPRAASCTRSSASARFRSRRSASPYARSSSGLSRSSIPSTATTRASRIVHLPQWRRNRATTPRARRAAGTARRRAHQPRRGRRRRPPDRRRRSRRPACRIQSLSGAPRSGQPALRLASVPPVINAMKATPRVRRSRLECVCHTNGSQRGRLQPGTFWPARAFARDTPFKTLCARSAMDATIQYDAIIIGAGPACGPLAGALARAGRRTALIERVHVGGTCINEGCTPTKTMVASARVAYLARRAADYGVRAGSVAVDMAAVRRRKRAIVDSFRSGSERRITTTAGLDLLLGEARFAGPDTVELRRAGGTRGLSAPLIFINTGGRPTRPALPGIESVPTLDSTSIMELAELPEHLLVLGGGYIGLEFGQMFRRFGSRVTIVQRAARLVPREDADVAEEIRKILCEDGVEVLLNTKAASAEPVGDGRIRLVVQNGGSERALLGSHLLLAAGRSPNSEALDLGAAGVETDKNGFIKVNERLETSVPGVYALGDVKGGPAFTHISYDDFRIVRTNLLEGGHASTRDRLVPNA